MACAPGPCRSSPFVSAWHSQRDPAVARGLERAAAEKQIAEKAKKAGTEVDSWQLHLEHVGSYGTSSLAAAGGRAGRGAVTSFMEVKATTG